MKPLLKPLSLLLVLGAVPAAGAQEPDAAHIDAAHMAVYRHASACVAVLKKDAVDLVALYRAGQTELRPDIVRLTELGFGFIGTAYKNGLRNPLADRLLDEAEQAQKRAAPEALKRLSADCRREGAQLLIDANFIERALVSNRARARVEKLLAPPPDKTG